MFLFKSNCAFDENEYGNGNENENKNGEELEMDGGSKSE